MTDKEQSFFKKRISELMDIAYRRSIPTHSRFLNADEQAVLQTMHLSAPGILVVPTGGFEGAERRIVCFVPSWMEELPEDLFTFLRVSPRAPKFAEPLSHRDYLGALMGLGIRREMTGDISVDGNCAHIVVLPEIAEVILREYTEVRHTAVRVERESAEDFRLTVHTERREINTASLRVDGMISAVWKLSRSNAHNLLAEGKVFVNSAAAEGGSRILKPGEILSVREKGRFRLLGEARPTRSGRMYVLIEVYL